MSNKACEHGVEADRYCSLCADKAVARDAAHFRRGRVAETAKEILLRTVAVGADGKLVADVEGAFGIAEIIEKAADDPADNGGAS